MELVKQQIMVQPKPVRQSMLSKIKEIAWPRKTNKKEPVMQTNTRGRPNLKAQEKKNKARKKIPLGVVKPCSYINLGQDLEDLDRQDHQEPVTHSSYVNLQQDYQEPGTHSSYVNLQQDHLDPAMHSSYIKFQQDHLDPARHSSYVNFQQDHLDPARHSSYVNFQQDHLDPARHSSYVNFQQYHHNLARYSSFMNSQPTIEFSSIATVQQTNTFNYYINQIPEIFHPFIERVEDVTGDGNCGFRAVAVGLGHTQDNWLYIRNELLIETYQNEILYKDVFDKGVEGPTMLDKVRTSLSWSGPGFAPKPRWMLMPYTGILIANRFGVVVHFLTNKGSATFFPLWSSPTKDYSQHKFVSFLHVNNDHFIMVQLKGDYPMPTPSYYWRCYKNQIASAWETMYSSRLEVYQKIIEERKTQGFVNLDY